MNVTAITVANTGSKVAKNARKYAAIEGVRPECVMLDIHSLSVDPRYQRGVNRERAAAIAKKWNWNAYKALSVARRPDGSLFVYDGQHTLTAAIIRGDILMLPCMVRPIESVPAEAVAFLLTNDAVHPNKHEKHKTGAVGDDPIASMVQDALDAAGIELTKSTYGPRKTTAIGAFYNVVGKKPNNGAAERLATLLDRLLTTWPADDMVLSGRFVEGMSRFLSGVERQDPDMVPKVLARIGKNPARFYLSEAEMRAKLIRKPILRTLVDFLAETHNYKLRVGKLQAIDLE